MTQSASDNSNGSTEVETPPPAELDKVFTPPSQREWSESALAGLAANATLSSLAHETLDGLSIAVLYDTATGEACTGLPYRDMVSGWDNRVALEHATNAEDANRQLLEALSAGNTSIQITANAQTDFATLLNGIMLDVAPISLRISHDLAKVADNFKRHIDAQNMDSAGVNCSFNADPVGNWLTEGDVNVSLDTALATLGQFATDTRKQFPLSKTVLVDSTIHHNAGASATQELHAAIATGTLYLEALINAGMSAEQASAHIVFQMSCDADVLMGVIKLRSLAHLWQHVLGQFNQVSGSTPDGNNKGLSLVVETSRRNQSRIEHWNNHLRNMAACTAAAMGNATTIIVHPHDCIDDWAADEDGSLGARMARNLPIILDRESGLISVNDPFKGSHAIETLTSQLINKTWQSLSDMGNSAGWLSSIQSGEWQASIGEIHAQRLTRLSDEKSIMVGINRFTASGTNTTTQAIHHSEKGGSSGLKLVRVRDAESYEAGLASVQSSDKASTH